MKYFQIDQDNFQIFIPKVSRIPKNPKLELELLADTIPNEITVLASGGIDSEALILALHKIKKVTASAYALVYDNKIINQHDLDWLAQLKKYSINIEIDYINLNTFWTTSFYHDFIKKYKCVSPQLPLQVQMARIQSWSKFTILPAIHPEPKLINGETYIQFREKDFTVIEDLKKFKNILVNPLCSSSEMIASIMLCDEFRNFNKFGAKDGRARKAQQYKEYLGVSCEPRPKYHGFEKIQKVDNNLRKEIWDKYHYSSVDLYVRAEDMLENLFFKDTTYSTLDNKYITVMSEGPVKISQAKME